MSTLSQRHLYIKYTYRVLRIDMTMITPFSNNVEVLPIKLNFSPCQQLEPWSSEDKSYFSKYFLSNRSTIKWEITKNTCVLELEK